ncbi:hypothetical protein HK405_007107 [Cladochytrium tenue]|nr:hypothetical protein HK405_007107 [Cladochytrium tenue]
MDSAKATSSVVPPPLPMPPTPPAPNPSPPAAAPVQPAVGIAAAPDTVSVMTPAVASLPTSCSSKMQSSTPIHTIDSHASPSASPVPPPDGDAATGTLRQELRPQVDAGRLLGRSLSTQVTPPPDAILQKPHTLQCSSGCPAEPPEHPTHIGTNAAAASPSSSPLSQPTAPTASEHNGRVERLHESVLPPVTSRRPGDAMAMGQTHHVQWQTLPSPSPPHALPSAQTVAVLPPRSVADATHLPPAPSAPPATLPDLAPVPRPPSTTAPYSSAQPPPSPSSLPSASSTSLSSNSTPYVAASSPSPSSPLCKPAVGVNRTKSFADAGESGTSGSQRLYFSSTGHPSSSSPSFASSPSSVATVASVVAAVTQSSGLLSNRKSSVSALDLSLDNNASVVATAPSSNFNNHNHTHTHSNSSNTIVTDLHVAGTSLSSLPQRRTDSFMSKPRPPSASSTSTSLAITDDDETKAAGPPPLSLPSSHSTSLPSLMAGDGREQSSVAGRATPSHPIHPDILSLPATHILYSKKHAVAASPEDTTARKMTENCKTIREADLGIIEQACGISGEGNSTPSMRSVATLLPLEILLEIFGHFDPHPTDALFLLSQASTTVPLYACALVCRWWNRAAVSLLWRRPWLHDISRVETLVKTAELSSASYRSTFDAASDAPFGGQTVSGGMSVQKSTSHPYHSLIKHLTLSATLPESHRNSSALSGMLTRLLSLPAFHLTVLDLGFCKGVSNFSLQRCANSLSRLAALNLAGGGRSEICVIKVARECGPRLRRLGLGWNPAIGDFCVKEVVRLCPALEWIDLSGCNKVGDLSCMAIAKRWCQSAVAAPRRDLFIGAPVLSLSTEAVGASSSSSAGVASPMSPPPTALFRIGGGAPDVTRPATPIPLTPTPPTSPSPPPSSSAASSRPPSRQASDDDGDIGAGSARPMASHFRRNVTRATPLPRTASRRDPGGGGSSGRVGAIFNALATSPPSPTLLFQHPLQPPALPQPPTQPGHPPPLPLPLFPSSSSSSLPRVPPPPPPHAATAEEADPVTLPDAVGLRFVCLNYCLGVTDTGVRELLERGGAGGGSSLSSGVPPAVRRLEVLSVLGCPDVRGAGWWMPSAAADVSAAPPLPLPVTPPTPMPTPTLTGTPVAPTRIFLGRQVSTTVVPIAAATPPIRAAGISPSGGGGGGGVIRGTVWVGPHGVWGTGAGPGAGVRDEAAAVLRAIRVNETAFVPFWR